MNNDKKPCTPDGIRVWRGFRSRAFIDKKEDFDKKVGSIFVPQTAQQMEPLGLCAYFPALLPDSIPPDTSNPGPNDLAPNDIFLKIPDEIALVVYPSKEAYEKATTESVAGRAYGLLHVPVFNFDDKDPAIPPSKSGDPTPWSGELVWDVPCYLVPDAIDWQSGVTRLLAAKPAIKFEGDDFLDRLNDILRGWLMKRDENIDGSIICACPDYLLYWEHRKVDTDDGSLIPMLLDLLETPYINKSSSPVIVPPAFHEPDKGVDIKVGDFLDVRVDTFRKE